MIVNSKISKIFKKYLTGNYAKNLFPFFLLIVFILTVWKIMDNINNIEIKNEDIPNYNNLIDDPNKRVDEFKKGIKIIEITKNKQFIELEQEDNLIKEGKWIKGGNMFIKKF